MFVVNEVFFVITRTKQRKKQLSIRKWHIFFIRTSNISAEGKKNPFLSFYSVPSSRLASIVGIPKREKKGVGKLG